MLQYKSDSDANFSWLSLHVQAVLKSVHGVWSSSDEALAQGIQDKQIAVSDSFQEILEMGLIDSIFPKIIEHLLITNDIESPTSLIESDIKDLAYSTTFNGVSFSYQWKKHAINLVNIDPELKAVN